MLNAPAYIIKIYSEICLLRMFGMSILGKIDKNNPLTPYHV